MAKNIKNQKRDEFEERVIDINRVAKTAKGGRTIRFTALVAVGDKNGRIGIGSAKGLEVPDAINKAVSAAKKNIVRVPLVGTTIPHEITGIKGAGRVLLKPASEGTGVLAGGTVRAVCELAGIQDIRAKSLGSANPRSIVNATMQGLNSLKTVEEVAKLRDKSVDEILG